MTVPMEHSTELTETSHVAKRKCPVDGIYPVIKQKNLIAEHNGGICMDCQAPCTINTPHEDFENEKAHCSQ